MKTIVIYRSKTGYTRKYAAWIAEELGCEAIELDTLKNQSLSGFDCIIYGGGLYVVGINGLKKMLRLVPSDCPPKLIVYACGATPDRYETTREIRDKNFTPEQQQQIPFFYLRGGFDFRKLGVKDKFLMILLRLKLKMMRHKSPDVKGMLAAYGAPADFSKKRYASELLDLVGQFTF